MLSQLHEATVYIQTHSQSFRPEIGIILGTGLGALAKEVEVEHEINYADIPNFPLSTVESHAGRLLLGRMGSKQVAVLQGPLSSFGISITRTALSASASTSVL